MEESAVFIEKELETLDLSSQELKKLPKPTENESLVRELNIDNNELQRLDNIDAFTRLISISAANNRLCRMYAVCRMQTLQSINLSNNAIPSIEGLKDLINLKSLNLSGNNIKVIEHLNHNAKLDELDLSRNCIVMLTDVSFLKQLKVLQLHKNKIAHLRHSERYLPGSLVTLTLAANHLSDLNEIMQLTQLPNLRSISLNDNPCVSMIMMDSSSNSILGEGKVGFDYRPFVINWCTQVQVIDGYAVDAIESLRGEWLYSQGRGRHFRIGEHAALVQYLATVCPLSAAQPLETEEDRKLRLILSKAQHHQQQLRDESSNSATATPTTTNTSSRPASKLSLASSSRISSPRFSRALNSASAYRTRSPASAALTPDRHPMSASYYSPVPSSSATIDLIRNDSLMSRSLDSSVLMAPPLSLTSSPSNLSCGTRAELSNGNGGCSGGATISDLSGRISADGSTASSHGLLQALSKLVPVPESLMSPDYVPPHSLPTSVNNTLLNSTIADGSSESSSASNPTVAASPKLPRSNIAVRRKSTKSDWKPPEKSAMYQNHATPDTGANKLLLIEKLTNEKRSKELAAIYIQKMWRGFHARNRNKTVLDVVQRVQTQRTQQSLHQLGADLDNTRTMLESEHRIQVLQMQAINALWKKVSGLQGTQDLAQTCEGLRGQVAQLQASMEDMMRVMSTFSPPTTSRSNISPTTSATAVQTDIIAVRTPTEPTIPIPSLFPHLHTKQTNTKYQEQTKEESSTTNQQNQTTQQQRPRTLSLPPPELSTGVCATVEYAQFADSLLDGVITAPGCSATITNNLS